MENIRFKKNNFSCTICNVVFVVDAAAAACFVYANNIAFNNLYG
jgi:hypothetical protein